MVLQRWCVFLIVMFFVATDVVAQVERVLPRRGGSSLEGTSFVVGFMANEILEVGEDPRVQVFISSQFDATVTISSPLISPVTYTVPANTVRVFSMNAMQVVNASEQVSPKAIFIEADVPIVVYTLNTLALSTDSYTAIPIKHCGTDYYTVNRPTDWYRPGRTPNPLDRAPRVGEFMVMATEDGTDVVITPRVRTKGGRAANQSFNVKLNKGDCYLVQAHATRHGGDDLTGSSINASLPVAVLSGHMRSSVPTDSSISKDHLVEQLPPVNKWGRTYATSPFAQIQRPDAFRIVGSRNDQTIRLTTRFGSSTVTLSSPGQWRDTVLKEPVYWSSDEPFLLTQFMSSSTSGAYGDPAMVIVPPVEQFVNQSLFQFPVLEESGLDNQQYFYFINLVAEASALSTLRVNATPVTTIAPQIRTQTIPGTSLHWATLQLSEGAFMMQADTGLYSGVMYGTSVVDSYANMIGVAYDSVRVNDVSPPVYRLAIECGEVSGVVRDSSELIPKLDDVRVIQSRTTNYRWSIAPSTDNPGELDIWAQVKDLWRDAQIVIHAYDDQGNGKEWLYRYDAPNVTVPADIVIDATGVGQQCTTAVFQNRDSTPVTIARISLSGDVRFTMPPPSIRDTVIAPGDSLVVTVCIRPTTDTSQARGTLIIEYPCRLQRFVNVRSATTASLETVPLDFGDVRVGDTACSRLPIINTGLTDVIITAILIERALQQFSVDITRLSLPKLLKPKDTLWVPVCFTPDTVGVITRIDTVRSLPDCGLRTQMRGRGVQPQIPSIVIDWRLRRVGVGYDSTITIRNDGTGRAVINGWQSWSSAAAVVSSGPADAIALRPGETLSIPCILTPKRRGAFDQIDSVRVDWSTHPVVTVHHLGIGIQPDVRGIDIDFGAVVLGTSKDSLVDHLVSGGDGGNTSARVSQIRIVGPDAAAFVISPVVLATSALASIDTLRALTRFVPLRSGSHRCIIEVDYDGRYGAGDTTIRYELRGQGIVPVRANLGLRVATARAVSACQPEPLTITIANSGDGIARIDTIEIISDAGRRLVLADSSGVVLLPGGQQQWNTAWMVTRSSDPTIIVRVVDSAGVELRDTVVMTVTMPSVSLSLAVNGAPLLMTGSNELRASVRLDAPTSEDISARVTIVVPQSRFFASTVGARVTGVRPSGFVDTIVSVTQSRDTITLDLPLSAGPWSYQVGIAGDVLWEDPKAFSMHAAVDSSPCYNSERVELDDLVVSPCGSSVRVVRLTGRPQLIVDVLTMPARENLVLRIDSEAATTVKITIETLAGQHFTLVEGFSLQKGVQHCNFSCSGWATGVYRVKVHGDSGETDCKVIIVN